MIDFKQRQRELLNPNWADARRFPVFRPGWTTAGYIAHYEAMNKGQRLTCIEFTHARGHPAPVEKGAEA